MIASKLEPGEASNAEIHHMALLPETVPGYTMRGTSHAAKYNMVTAIKNNNIGSST